MDPERKQGTNAAAEVEEASMGMEALLEEEAGTYKRLNRGDIVEGEVMGTSRDGILVDVGSKSEGIVPLHEAHSLGSDPLERVTAGDKVLVYVMQPETAEGQILLSFDRARGEKGWRILQDRFEAGEAFDAKVSGFNKGGLLVNVEGVHAFVPLSQVVGARPGTENGEGSLSSMVGKNLHLKVIEINRRRNRVILSERAALQEWRSQQKDRLLTELKEGEVRTGKISSIRPFGVFVDLGGADGLAHLSELSWDRNRSPEELFKVGDEVSVYVMKVDQETKKIALSVRRAQPEQWEEIVDKYRVGQVVPGVITKLVPFGAFARIDGPVEGLVHVSELVDRRIAHPKEVVREGDILPLKVVRIERDRHRLGLSLRQAREEGEQMGFAFAASGEVEDVPLDLKEKFAELTKAVIEQAEAAAASAPPEEVEADETVEETAPAVEAEAVEEEETTAALAPAGAEAVEEEETTAALAPAEAEAVVEEETTAAPAVEAEAVVEETTAAAAVEAEAETEAEVEAQSAPVSEEEEERPSVGQAEQPAVEEPTEEAAEEE